MLIFNQRYALMPQLTETAHNPDTTPQARQREARRQALLAKAQQSGGYDTLNFPEPAST